MYLVLFLLLSGVKGSTIGTIKQSRISSTALSTWLYNQSSWLQCACYALRMPSIVAFNSYALNASCQFFQNLSSSPFQLTKDPNVTVYLLQPLQSYAPCCSNLTWLLAKMQSTFATSNVNGITGIALDTDRNRIATVGSSVLRLVSADSLTTLNLKTTLPTYSQPVTYYRNLFYAGIFPAKDYTLYIYSALNLTLVEKMSFNPGSPQHIVWLHNETLACILLQLNTSLYSLVNFYNWPSKTLNKSIRINISNAYGLGKAPNDDTFVYITDGRGNGSVWRLQTSPPYNFTVFIAGTSINETPMAVSVDSCNRFWVVFIGYGIRIYNISTRATLATWNLAATYSVLYDMVLTNQYQLYLSDKRVGKLARYGSALQCTC